jgi:hypothetical protein
MCKTRGQNKVRLSDIYESYFDAYLANPKHPVSKETLKAVNQTIACRTPRIGVNVYQCPECLEKRYVYRSCKNRFCPRCGYVDTQKWAQAMTGKIAECSHHHIIFTLPGSLRFISRSNKDTIHSLLMRSTAETMIDWFNAKHRIRPGIMSVLHTAGSDQKYHPHVHMICSAGGITNREKFKEIPDKWYLVSQHFLAKKFRWHFERGLFELYEKGELKTSYKKMYQFKEFINRVNKQDWIVNVQRPLKDVEDIINYVGRYTKRACISEYNILSDKEGIITIRYKDYKDLDSRRLPRMKEISLGYRDFFARLFEHVPSKGFRMVRYYGMYSSRWINKRPKKSKSDAKQGWRDYQIIKTGEDPLICPCCHQEMIFVKAYYDHRTRWIRREKKDKVPDHWPEAV